MIKTILRVFVITLALTFLTPIPAEAKGEITQFDYDEMVQKIYTTGNAYDIQIEAQIIDDNPIYFYTNKSAPDFLAALIKWFEYLKIDLDSLKIYLK